MKLKLLFCLFTGIVFNGYAQIEFQDNVIIEDLDLYDSNNITFDIADIDGDGDADFVIGLNNEIGWLENLDGLGNFSNTKVIDPSITSRKIYAVDIDGDSDLDILSGDSARIIWYENTDGLGNFDNQYEINFNGDMVSFSDVDGDGDMDIVATDGSLVWFENTDGQGNFSPSQIITNTETILVYHFTDIDGDNDLDIVGGEDYPGQRIVWYENTNGLGDYGPAVEIAVLNFGTLQEYSASAISSIDFDNDGDMDILATTDTNVGDLVWFENTDGQGTFGIETNFGSFGSSIEIIDINGDGFLDIVKAGGDNEGDTVWYENNQGSGSFTGSYLGYPGLSSIITKSADIDGDGDIDIAIAKIDNSTISWRENLNSLGGFGISHLLLTSIVQPKDAFSVDMDGDGDMDVVCNSDYRIAWFENVDGLGDFGRIKLIDAKAVNSFSFSDVQTSDLDLDGDIDIIAYTTGAGSVSWYENTDGLGTFIKHNIGIDENIKSIHVTDLDSDGDDDIIIAKNYENGISWYENTDGLATFSALQPIITASLWSKSVTIADIDNDGDNDIVSNSDYSITWYENTDGQGTFNTTAQTIAIGFNDLGLIKCIDIDNDNDIDVATIDNGNNNFEWFENLDGQGTFSTNGSAISTDTESVSDMFFSDLDNDNDLDVIVIAEFNSGVNYPRDIYWYENTDGQGSFGTEQLVSTLPRVASSVFASDIDLDGDLDVLSASIFDHRIAWYKNSLIDNLSIEDYIIDKFKIYPNPVSNNLIIESKTPFNSISIYDIEGRKLKTVQTDFNLNYNFEVNFLNQGLYFIEIQSGKLKQTKKFIKK